MKRFLPILIVTFLLAQCVNHDESDLHSEPSAIARACNLCGTRPGDMDWLRDIIHEMDQDPGKSGDLYAVSTSQGTVFIHQPLVMSCWACIRYTCTGDILVMDEQQFREEMPIRLSDSHVIYRSY